MLFLVVMDLWENSNVFFWCCLLPQDTIFFNAAIASLTSRWPFAGVLFECLQQEWLKAQTMGRHAVETKGEG